MSQEKVSPAWLAETNTEHRVEALLAEMSIAEKIGQMAQMPHEHHSNDWLKEQVRQGRAGSVLNIVYTARVNELQRIAVEESRLGIPLIIGRDVIHGYQTMMPIPLGQAATWNPDLVERGARVSAIEAASDGINWTFAPMLDICRDPRWGRIAESLGEDPYLASVLGKAMVKGFQGKNLSDSDSIAACAKHFAAYGYSEAGRDYAYVNISENELRNVVLPPFKACADAGVATFMTAFSDINGVPATANDFLLREILREEWKYDGFVVSDWDSVSQLITHGFAENERAAAKYSLAAGLDMEMSSKAYLNELENLLVDGESELKWIDDAVRRILRVKFELGLFDRPYTNVKAFPVKGNKNHLQAAYECAVASCVLLKNDYQTLPIRPEKQKKIAVIGPLADDGYEQMGTWTFDGKEEWCITPLRALRDALGENAEISYVKALPSSRSNDKSAFAEAIAAARIADTVIMFMGEEAILSGEAHSRADIDLPGAQNELLEEISKLGKSTVLVILAGRPLTLGKTQHLVNAVLYAWHPGTMGGPAIIDLLLGKRSPVGKLPVSFPSVVGQIPIYYNHRMSGKPATYDSFTFIDDIVPRAPQTSVGNTSFHLDAGFEPLYPFGYGLTYTHFSYSHLELSSSEMSAEGEIEVKCILTNEGQREGTEIVQLYIRDRFGSVTRPVRELKKFQHVQLSAGQSTPLVFRLKAEDLAFYNRQNKWSIEPGDFDVWIGGDSKANLHQSFRILAN